MILVSGKPWLVCGPGSPISEFEEQAGRRQSNCLIISKAKNPMGWIKSMQAQLEATDQELSRQLFIQHMSFWYWLLSPGLLLYILLWDFELVLWVRARPMSPVWALHGFQRPPEELMHKAPVLELAAIE